MIDQSKKLALIRKIRRIQSHTQGGKEKEVVLSLNDYFDGDTSECCAILANTTKQLSSEACRHFLDGIASRPEVPHILIRFYDYEDALDFDDSWINSDTVFISTSASLTEVNEWFNPLEPTTVEEVIDTKGFANLPAVPSGHRLFAVWWD